jgi:hypothetical protein
MLFVYNKVVIERREKFSTVYFAKMRVARMRFLPPSSVRNDKPF